MLFFEIIHKTCTTSVATNDSLKINNAATEHSATFILFCVRRKSNPVRGSRDLDETLYSPDIASYKCLALATLAFSPIPTWGHCEK